MVIHIELTQRPIDCVAARNLALEQDSGALAEFTGLVRSEEEGGRISALEYEAYESMAVKVMREILTGLGKEHPTHTAVVVHRTGIVPVGEAAIYLAVTARHRAAAFAVVTQFMDRLKQDVPIWKRRAIHQTIPAAADANTSLNRGPLEPLSCDEALAEILERCETLAGVAVPLNRAANRVLREVVSAREDLPACDRSTRDGFAILENDNSARFVVVDTLHAADWKPRQLLPGQAVRIATGAALPCPGLRVVMQEDVLREGDTITISTNDPDANVRRRGEEVRAGAPLLDPGVRLTAGRLALLATAGCVKPLVSPALRVLHFTTGDEIVPPDRSPGPGQIRDSNSIFVRSLLEAWGCEVNQMHLAENFDRAKEQIASLRTSPDFAEVILVSGGASVGDKDFTRPLLEWLGFDIVYNRVRIRPGAPLIFGVSRQRIAFGLPGNPLSHYVCVHLFVKTALARLSGARPETFASGKLAGPLEEPSCPRETFWPARQAAGGLFPLRWASSGDLTCLADANALIRVPANSGPLREGTEIVYWPALS